LNDAENIVKLVGWTRNPLSICTKLYEMSLFDLLFKHDIPLGPVDVRNIALQIARGCQAIHSK